MKMTVTAILPLDRRRCKIFLDGEFAFVLYRSEMKKFEMEEKGELKEADYCEIMQTLLPKRARERALYFLKTQDRTEAEILRKLREGGYPPSVCQSVLAFLKEYRYVDDASYAAHYIESQKDRKSTKRLRYDLMQKGIPDTLLKELLEENPCDEEKQIRAWLEKKHLTPGELDIRERQKAMASLARKGFSWDAIQRIFRL